MAGPEPPRSSHGSTFGPGFGNTNTPWSGGIWGNSAIGSGLKNPNDNARIQDERVSSNGVNEALTGSGSLLSTSESDTWAGRHRPPWQSVDNNSPGISGGNTRRTGTSPMRRQSSNQSSQQPFGNPSTIPNYFPLPSTSSNQGLPQGPQQHLSDPDAGVFGTVRDVELNGFSRSSRHNSDENERLAAGTFGFGNNDVGFSIQPQRQNSHHNTTGLNSNVASRSGSIPPSRNGLDPASQFDRDPQSLNYAHVNGSTGSGQTNHSKLSAQALAFQRSSNAYNHRFGDSTGPTDPNNMTAHFGMLDIAKENQSPPNGYGLQIGSAYHERLLPYELSQQGNFGNAEPAWDADEKLYPPYGDPYVQNMALPLSSYRQSPFSSGFPHSPGSSEGRRNPPSSYYPSNSSSPYPAQPRTTSRNSLSSNTPASQSLIADRKFRGAQHEQQGFLPSHAAQVQYRHAFPNPYDFHPQQALRMNINPYYPVPQIANLLPPAAPRGPAKDQDTAHSTRSACLEEFRSNSKTNKRYELKDIYGHIVEFSGDQHGSRFIQQKLETANSDEKDQAFREILPNAMQLMTDVFGNYVIQKFFEHGNQTQKKILANQMKNHVLALSLQMYGCRVVQKALEHILTDQQASLIGELQKDKQVMRCVKDQNGNHVVQKAIERIPAEHIQFIVNAFTGQVHELSKHAYGCRVIQRMLEHCVEPTRSAILQELHGCAQHLIGDQYGNYVTQHIIEHGRDEDRARIISLVTSNIINYSKHKFASNVVETCIKFGDAEQRKKIVDILSAVNEKGDSNLQYLIRDQYCNYVIQTLIHELKGAELDEFIETLKPQLAILKRFAYGKQVQAIEALLYTTMPPIPARHRTNSAVPPPIDTSASVVPTPPLLTGDGQSPQSFSVPSTNASSVGGGAGSRKSSTSNAVEVMTPTST
ncbi:MAG: hypothetical protein L6R37_005823 [Teloschistes peruensis]|nr:MAG: hypothetical protein L6R37_005823 [Teloschistes peruensis]